MAAELGFRLPSSEFHNLKCLFRLPSTDVGYRARILAAELGFRLPSSEFHNFTLFSIAELGFRLPGSDSQLPDWILAAEIGFPAVE